MPFHQIKDIRYYSFDLLDEAGVTNAVFTRRGGVSPAPWHSLNLGGTVGDLTDNVKENRRRCFEAIGLKSSCAFDVWQVHSDRVIRTERPRLPEEEHERADAIITDHADVSLYMRFADCVPILLVDPVHHALGLVHAGWLGTVKQIAGLAVQAMVDEYGSKPENILAGIGPSICIEHYPVGSEVVDQIWSVYGNESKDLIQRLSDQQHLDLWAANKLTLERAGVQKIQVSGLCTAHHVGDWYSHRAEHGKTGRFGAILAWRKNHHGKPSNR